MMLEEMKPADFGASSEIGALTPFMKFWLVVNEERTKNGLPEFMFGEANRVWKNISKDWGRVF